MSLIVATPLAILAAWISSLYIIYRMGSAEGSIRTIHNTLKELELAKADIDLMAQNVQLYDLAQKAYDDLDKNGELLQRTDQDLKDAQDKLIYLENLLTVLKVYVDKGKAYQMNNEGGREVRNNLAQYNAEYGIWEPYGAARKGQQNNNGHKNGNNNGRQPEYLDTRYPQ